ncbi:glycosyltransferase [Hydrogenophaga electricum]|uniref:Group 1 glycosyl transferase n=1 Tax=Hydrogenophaga electricum TaxID=1230953 RepID=A0ABQ6C1V1_9BURK|nr:glycosyltransferase [Hydrogenophaga electricum]GLS13880.1 group 1 glycosyl transferase [Hydrogenophaga electricum]
MKALFATYPMAFHTPGGGEVQLLAYRDHLPAAGVDVTLFDLWNPRFAEHDVVHFFSCVGGSVHFCHFVKNLGKPLVVTSSLWITEATQHQYPMDEIRAQLLLADRIVTNSEMESDTLARVLRIHRDRFASVYNGVDAVFRHRPDASQFRQAFGVKGRFVLNVGNIEPRKNQARLAQAMDVLPDHQLILIGHVRDQAYFQQMMDAAPPGRVRYLGPIPHHDDLLRSAYQACDLFCLPSTLETPGLAALEAAAQGCRLVITAEGSTREYFGEAAVYIDPLDVAAIRQGLREGAEPAAPQPVPDAIWERYAWQQVVRKLRQVYEGVC